MIGVVLLLVLGAVFFYWRSTFTEDTDDAQVDGNLYQVSSRIAGHVVKVYVEDNQQVQQGQLLVEIDPTEERAHRLLMRCYVFLDRPAEALRQFERCRAVLREELAARPSPATVSLLEAIREGVTVTHEDDSVSEPAALSSDPLFR